MQTTQQGSGSVANVEAIAETERPRRFEVFRTRNVTLLFAVLFGLGFAETLYLLFSEPFTGDLAFDVGFAVGWLLVGGTIDLAVAAAVTLVVTSLYLGGRRLVRAIRR